MIKFLRTTSKNHHKPPGEFLKTRAPGRKMAQADPVALRTERLPSTPLGHALFSIIADLQARARRAEPGRRGGETWLPTSWRMLLDRLRQLAVRVCMGPFSLAKGIQGFRGPGFFAFCFVLGFRVLGWRVYTFYCLRACRVLGFGFLSPEP